MVKIFLLLFLFILFWRGATAKYINPYKLVILFGPKGCGKSTYLTRIGLRYLSRGRRVYANFPLPGACVCSAAAFVDRTFPPESVILIDEAALDWDNRAFKSFPGGTLEWFRLQRHERCIVYLASQSYDIDKKLRSLADELWIFNRVFTVFSWGRRVIKKIVVTEPGQDGESRITETYKIDSFLFAFFGSRTFTFIPRYVGLFDSFSPLKRNLFVSRLFPGTISVPLKRSVACSFILSGVLYYKPFYDAVMQFIVRLKSAADEVKHESPSESDIAASKRYNLATFFHGLFPPDDV